MRATHARTAAAQPAAKASAVTKGCALMLSQSTRSRGAGSVSTTARVLASQVRPTNAEPIRSGARAALAATRATAMLATKVAPDGMDAMRAALVERSLRDARADADGLGIKGASDELLRGLMTAAMRAIDRRFAPGTKRLDKSYWKFWEQHCAMLGTPPWRTNASANAGADPVLHRREIAIALSALMAYIADNPTCKVQSMVNRIKGVARRHISMSLTFVSLALVVMAADGMVQEHIDAHGTDALQPKSKEPLNTEEIHAALQLPIGTVVGDIVVGPNIEWQGARVFIALFANSGFRKEAVALGQGEVLGPRKLRLSNVIYRIDGEVVRNPSHAQLEAMLRGDYLEVVVYVLPVPCKNDPTNQKFGNSPIPSRLRSHRVINFAREMITYELMRRTEGIDRSAVPLLLATRTVNRLFSKKALDKLFKQIFGSVVTPARLSQITIHSFRVYLACALLAAGATPEQVMLLLRWSSEAARKLYARVADATQ